MTADLHPDYVNVSLPDHVASETKPNCEICLGQGWVCEDHPKLPWDGGDLPSDICCPCQAPGMPCQCTGLQNVVIEPRA